MRSFRYYFFENFDEGQLNDQQEDPRRYLNSKMDCILSDVAASLPFSCTYPALCSKYTQPVMDKLIACGLFQKVGEAVLLDSPVFLQEDAAQLYVCLQTPVSRLTGRLEGQKQKFYALAEQLDNGFDAPTNLYHLLCGMILDGLFFDCLSENGIVLTSKTHPSGLDYIITIYENCPELNTFSHKLLCSYNRFSDGKRSLQSFGDADGNRHDIYRFARLKEQQAVPKEDSQLEKLWDSLYSRSFRKELLVEVERMVTEGCCRESYKNLLTKFHYLKDGKICVPVYQKKHLPVIYEMESLTETCLLEEFRALFSQKDTFMNLTCAKHPVSLAEIGNELYHILFGLINEQLVSRGFVCAPPKYAGEGRYLKSIEIM